MSGDLIPKGQPEPQPQARSRWRWRSRAERDQLRAAHLQAELDCMAMVTEAQVQRIRAAGRARLHSDRSRYTAHLTVEASENFVEINRAIGRLLDREPPDPMLVIGLAEIEVTGLDVLKSHLHDHRRDGRDPL